MFTDLNFKAILLHEIFTLGAIHNLLLRVGWEEFILILDSQNIMPPPNSFIKTCAPSMIVGG